MQRFFTIVSLLICGILLQSCINHNDCGCVAPPDTGRSFYYPILGQAVVYDAEETQYAIGEKPTVKKYQVKEVFASVFTNASGKEMAKIESYRRANDQDTWEKTIVSTANVEQERALKTEDNITYVKMVFPISEGQKWDANAYNTLGADSYEVKNRNKPFTIDNQVLNRTVTIVQQYDSTLVDLKKRTETYADGIGLIYQEKTAVVFCNKADCLGKATIDFGTKYILKYKYYEKILP
jgi:hypothetical protein